MSWSFGVSGIPVAFVFPATVGAPSLTAIQRTCSITASRYSSQTLRKALTESSLGGSASRKPGSFVIAPTGMLIPLNPARARIVQPHIQAASGQRHRST